MKPLEKAARALAANAWRRMVNADSVLVNQRFPDGETAYVDDRWRLYAEDVRAVIASIEPDDAMVEAAHAAALMDQVQDEFSLTMTRAALTAALRSILAEDHPNG